jgi:hypothetical protein
LLITSNFSCRGCPGLAVCPIALMGITDLQDGARNLMWTTFLEERSHGRDGRIILKWVVETKQCKYMFNQYATYKWILYDPIFVKSRQNWQ